MKEQILEIIDKFFQKYPLIPPNKSEEHWNSKEKEEKEKIRYFVELIQPLPNLLSREYWLYLRSRFPLSEEFWKKIFKKLGIKEEKPPCLLYPKFWQAKPVKT
ncbi:MAG: hypothetical protein KJI70_03355 [Patescibacteria group bacterium]|nr:hypothetical protein [Patescibacteria group bacterium]